MEEVKINYRKFKLSKLAKVKPLLDWKNFIVIEADSSKNPYKEIDFAEGLRKVCSASAIHSVVRLRPSKSNIVVAGFDSSRTVSGVVRDELRVKGLKAFTASATSVMNTAMLILTGVPAQITNDEIARHLEPYAKVLKITYNVLGDAFSHAINGVRKVLVDTSENAKAVEELPRKILVKGHSICVHPTRAYSGQRKLCLKCGRLNHKRKSKNEEHPKSKKPKTLDKNSSLNRTSESLVRESSKTASSYVSDFNRPSSEDNLLNSIAGGNVLDEQSPGKQDDSSVHDETVSDEQSSEKPNELSFANETMSVMNTAMLILTGVPAQITNDEIARHLEPHTKVLKITYKVLGDAFSHVINGVRKVLVDISENAKAEEELPHKILIKGYSISVHLTRTYCGERKLCFKCGRLNHKRKSMNEEDQKSKKPKTLDKNSSLNRTSESLDRESSITASSDVSDFSRPNSEEHLLYTSSVAGNVSDEQLSGKQNSFVPDEQSSRKPNKLSVVGEIVSNEQWSGKQNDSFVANAPAVVPVCSHKIKVEREDLGKLNDFFVTNTPAAVPVLVLSHKIKVENDALLKLDDSSVANVPASVSLHKIKVEREDH